ncbi:MAG: cell envelope integrity protein TolA [Pseudomonadota bacterium]
MDFRRSLLFSVLFHLALLLVGLITFPSLTPNITSAISSIPVDLISDEDMMAGDKRGEKSETPQKKQTPTPVVKPPEEIIKPVEEKPPVEAKAAPTPPPEETVTKPPEEKPVEKPPEKAQAKPEEVDPEGLLKKIEDAKREEEKKQQEEDKKKKAEEEKKKAEEKKKIAEQKRKAEQDRLAKQAEKFDASKISNLINNQDGAPKPDADAGEEKKASLGAKQGTGKRLTQSQLGLLVGMIQDQIRPCWVTPPSATGSDFTISVKISVNSDGSLNGQPRITNSDSDPAFSAASGAATRAIVRCSPLKLPAEMYEDWKDITFSFKVNDF